MSEGRVFTVTHHSIPVAATTAEDLLEINPAAEQGIKPIGIVVTQSDDSGDSGDANEDQIEIIINRVTGSPTSGLGGTTKTPVKQRTGDQVFDGVVEAGNTTNLTGGTKEELWREGMNNRGGFYYWPPPEARDEIRGDEVLLIETGALHTNGHELDISIKFMEVG